MEGRPRGHSDAERDCIRGGRDECGNPETKDPTTGVRFGSSGGRRPVLRGRSNTRVTHPDRPHERRVSRGRGWGDFWFGKVTGEIVKGSDGETSCGCEGTGTRSKGGDRT